MQRVQTSRWCVWFCELCFEEKIFCRNENFRLLSPKLGSHFSKINWSWILETALLHFRNFNWERKASPHSFSKNFHNKETWITRSNSTFIILQRTEGWRSIIHMYKFDRRVTFLTSKDVSKQQERFLSLKDFRAQIFTEKWHGSSFLTWRRCHMLLWHLPFWKTMLKKSDLNSRDLTKKEVSGYGTAFVKIERELKTKRLRYISKRCGQQIEAKKSEKFWKEVEKETIRKLTKKNKLDLWEKSSYLFYHHRSKRFSTFLKE